MPPTPLVPGKPLSQGWRDRICELHRVGFGYKSIKSEHPELALSTIKYTIRMEKRRVDNATRPRSGRPKKKRGEEEGGDVAPPQMTEATAAEDANVSTATATATAITPRTGPTPPVKGKRLSQGWRDRICELHRVGFGYKSIKSQHPALDLSTIKYTIRMEKFRVDNANRPIPGRPKKKRDPVVLPRETEQVATATDDAEQHDEQNP